MTRPYLFCGHCVERLKLRRPRWRLPKAFRQVLLENKTASFQQLKPNRREVFLTRHRGFLKEVGGALAAAGYHVSKATLSRTWHGRFKRPDSVVVEAIEYAYRSVKR